MTQHLSISPHNNNLQAIIMTTTLVVFFFKKMFGRLRLSLYTIQSRQPIDVLNANGSGKTGSKAKLMNLWKFIRPDWFIVLTGIIFYAIIGATYPTVGVLIANLNAVSVYKYNGLVITQRFPFKAVNVCN